MRGLDDVATQYLAGPEVALVSPEIFGVVQVNDAVHRASLIRTEPGAENVAACFARLRSSPPRQCEYSFARMSGSTVAVVLSRRGRAEVTVASGRAVLVRHAESSGPSEGEYGFDDVVGVTLWIADFDEGNEAPIDDPDDDIFAVRDGVVAAARLRRRADRYAELPTETLEVVGDETRQRQTVQVDTVRVDDGVERVLAIPCPEGHLNPTHAMRCRICELPVETTLPSLVERQALGTLAFFDGTRAMLDGAWVIGRDPVAPQGVQADRILRFETAGTGLSRTHALVTVEGWQVFIEDRWSTNGTEVSLPGHPPRRLYAGEATPIVTGTRIDLGGAVWCVVEAAS